MPVSRIHCQCSKVHLLIHLLKGAVVDFLFEPLLNIQKFEVKVTMAMAEKMLTPWRSFGLNGPKLRSK